MKLFWKIFIWFLLAITLIVGVSIFVSWTTQSEPFAERWKTMFSRTVNVYTETAKQIYDNEGEIGVKKFLQTIRNSHQNREVCIVKENQSCFENDQTVVSKAFSGNNIEFDLIHPEENYVAKHFTTEKGEKYVLVMKVEIPRPPIPFGVDWKTRTIRISAIILTSAFLCYWLAKYLVKPVLSLQNATKLLAEGNLQTRCEIKRRDELGNLGKDFNEMAERIEQLIQSQKNLNRDISHELRSPLARVNVALELAKNTENNSQFLDRIEKESNLLNEMISNILTLAKLETNTANFQKHEVNLSKLIVNVVDDAKFEANSKGKSVEILQNDNCKVFGNERLLRSAIENILRNAVRYTKDKVEISLQTTENQAVIKIRDYGEGIPESELKEIFRPFHRISEARERKSGGIGLGLAITEQAVHAHAGKVSARNTENGLEVEIKLPFER
jgi:signal transduction histidine kinase